MNKLYFFIRDLFLNRNIIFELARQDFRAKYLGSYLGVFWAFLQPTIQILIFWFVFQVGFKSIPVDNYPFILWLIAGMIPWFFFSDALNSSTNSIREYDYLVKKVVFRVSILPIVKIIPVLFIHVFFILFVFVMFVLYGYGISVYELQVFYYMFAMIVLLIGLSWITASLLVFIKDMSQIVGMILQFGFWLTPIFWSMKMIPDQYHVLLSLNPLYYLIDGYRNSFVYHKWFWQDPWMTIYFWSISLVVLLVGAFLFKRLRPHFSDAL